jgi:hypothetical protein
MVLRDHQLCFCCTTSISYQSFLIHVLLIDHHLDHAYCIFQTYCPGELWKLHAWIDEGEYPTQQKGSLRAVDA